MMHIGSGNRDDWKFGYKAGELVAGATAQREFRLGRVKVWTQTKATLMAEIKETGLEITESLASQMSNYTTAGHGPQITVKPELQKKLQECHTKIQSHQQAADEYDGWVQVLSARPEQLLELAYDDWLYFFGKV